jgi:hypothetical protein
MIPTDAEANKRIKELLDAADRALFDSQRTTEQRLLQAYRQALDEVQGTIRKVFEATTTPTMTEMRKFDRLTAIEEQIAKEIKRLTQVSVNVTHEAVRRTFLTAYDQTTNALALGTGINLTFSPLNTKAIEYAVSDNLWLDLLKNTNATLMTEARREFETVLRTNARKEIVAGLAEGKPYGEIAKAIEQRFNVAATRARTIANTEMHKSYSKGRMEGILVGDKAAQRLGFRTVKVWKHNYSKRPGYQPRDTEPYDHVGAVKRYENGIPVTQPFEVGGELLEAPGLGADPANNINCGCSAQIEVLDLKDAETAAPPAQPKMPPAPKRKKPPTFVPPGAEPIKIPSGAPGAWSPDVPYKDLPLGLSMEDLRTRLMAEHHFRPILHDTYARYGDVQAGIPDMISDINVIRKQLDRMRRDFPEIDRIMRSYQTKQKALPYVNLQMEKQRIVKYYEQGKTHEAAAYWSPSDRKMAVGARGERTGTPSVLHIDRANYFTANHTIDNLFRHEFGHRLFWDYSTQEYDGLTWKQFWMKDSEYVPGAAKGRKFDWRNYWFGRNVGGYASEEFEEGFAESFAAYTHKDYGKPGFIRLPEWVEKYFDKILKTKRGVH